MISKQTEETLIHCLEDLIHTIPEFHESDEYKEWDDMWKKDKAVYPTISSFYRYIKRNIDSDNDVIVTKCIGWINKMYEENNSDINTLIYVEIFEQMRGIKDDPKFEQYQGLFSQTAKNDLLKAIE